MSDDFEKMKQRYEAESQKIPATLITKVAACVIRNDHDIESDSLIQTVMNSCAEGFTGEWDCSTDEGREGFKDMYDLLKQYAVKNNIDVSQAKPCE